MKGTANFRIIVLLACLASVGCQLDTPVIQRGANGRMGVLLNYSCGAHPCDPIDPAKPTIVMTHGWNPLPNRIRTTFAESSAKEIRCRCGDRYNLLSWDWNGVKVSPFNDEPYRIGRCQGRMMASALRSRGIVPQQTHMIAHSLGTIAAAQAAYCLSDQGPIAQMTLLDPPDDFHEMLFCKLGVTRHARSVENYWAPGCSGYGAPANYAGVFNCRIEGPTGLRGTIDLSMSSHVHVMSWYYRTIVCPKSCYGFQRSVFRNDCQAEPACEPLPEVTPTSGIAAPITADSIQLIQPARYTAGKSDGSRKR